MATSPDYSPVCSPDTSGPSGTSLDTLGPIPIGLGAATDLFCAAKAAEGASPRTVGWYRMILVRAVRRFGEARPVDAIPAAELRAWLLELRSTLSPESIAGYVRGLKAFGNWCAAEEVAAAAGFRALRRPKVPRRLIAPFSDPELRSLLALADERDRALALVLLDTAWGSETRIRSRGGAVVLVDQPTEQIPSANVARTDQHRGRRCGSWRGEAEGAMGSPAVVVLGMDPPAPGLGQDRAAPSGAGSGSSSLPRGSRACEARLQSARNPIGGSPGRDGG